jgi:hypothetical protein
MKPSRPDCEGPHSDWSLHRTRTLRSAPCGRFFTLMIQRPCCMPLWMS